MSEDQTVKPGGSAAKTASSTGLSRRGFIGSSAALAAGVGVRSAGAAPGQRSLRTERTQDAGPEIIIGTLGDGDTLNPFVVGENSESALRIRWIFDQFVGVTVDTFVPTPGLGLAADWTLDNLTYVFTIQENAKFSDGTDLTADDVAFTIKGMLAKETASFRQGKFIAIAGAEDFIAGSATDVAGLKVLGPKSLEITLARPDAPFLYNLCYIHPVPKAALEGKNLTDDEFFKAPIGAGPFVFESWEVGADFVATANPTYWQAGKPALARVIHRTIPDAQGLVAALLAGEIDSSNYPSPAAKEQLEDAGNLTVLIPPFSAPDGWQFNLANEWLAKKEVRRAIAMSLDMKQFALDSLYGLGQEGVGPIAPTNWAYDAELQPIPYDPEGAKELIATAGLPAEGVSIQFMVNKGNVLREDFLTYTQQQLKPLGINVEAEAIEYTTVLDRTASKDYDVNGVTGGVTAEPSELAELFTTGASRNFSNYSNPDLDILLKQAKEELDQEAAKPIYKDIQAILMDDLPIFWAWYRPFLHTVDKRFQGYTDSIEFGLHHTLENWTVTE